MPDLELVSRIHRLRREIPLMTPEDGEPLTLELELLDAEWRRRTARPAPDGLADLTAHALAFAQERGVLDAALARCSHGELASIISAIGVEIPEFAEKLLEFTERRRSAETAPSPARHLRLDTDDE
jgi:hypothetical protein